MNSIANNLIFLLILINICSNIEVLKIIKLFRNLHYIKIMLISNARNVDASTTKTQVAHNNGATASWNPDK